jgi:hypothetical protein
MRPHIGKRLRYVPVTQDGGEIQYGCLFCFSRKSVSLFPVSCKCNEGEEGRSG